jgi:hypothetical protein
VPIEDWISDPVASERHQRLIDAPPEQALEIALDTPLDADRLSWGLTRLRGLAPEGTLGDFLEGNGSPFVILDRGEREIVAGLAGTVWTLRGGKHNLRRAEDWEGWSEPGTVKAVGLFRAEPVPERGRSLLVTETQVEAVDEEARRKFRRYWLVVEPFSRLIRRRWLRAIEKRARESSTP